MKKLIVSLIILTSFANVAFADRLLTKKEISKLENENIPNYCLLVDTSILSKERNDFGRITKKKVPAWISFLANDIVKEKDILKRKQRIFTLVAFIAYKNKEIFKTLKEYINSHKHKEGIGGVALHLVGMRAYLKNSLGFGTLPVYQINVANYASKHMKVEGTIDYVKLGILLDKTLLLNADDEEDFVDRFLLLNSYFLTYSSTCIAQLFQSDLAINTFSNNVVKEYYKNMYNSQISIDFMIETFTNILIKNANNPKINALIYHLIKKDAISFMLKDKKVLEKYKTLKSIYLKYKKAHKC